MLIHRSFRAVAVSIAALALGQAALADGSIFLTGHDPDFHAFDTTGNFAGARRINQVAIGFVQDPAFNPFVAAAPKFLFVQSRIPVPAGHLDGELGLIASGYNPGVQFDTHTALTLNAALNQLGQPGGYSAIVVASDHGGILTQAELDILNARTADIATFINAGGGLYAMAESNSGAGLTPGGGRYAFVPGVVSSTVLNQTEVGFTVSAFGASIGLSAGDVNGNFSHNAFTNFGALTPVSFDAAGNVISAAGRIAIPAPGAAAVLMLMGGFASRRRR